MALSDNDDTNVDAFREDEIDPPPETVAVAVDAIVVAAPPAGVVAADQLFLAQVRSMPHKRSSLAGTPPCRSLKTRLTPSWPALAQTTAFSLHSGSFGGLKSQESGGCVLQAEKKRLRGLGRVIRAV